jgi:hypothetical protein
LLNSASESNYFQYQGIFLQRFPDYLSSLWVLVNFIDGSSDCSFSKQKTIN